jgi:hypothetical protein
MTLSSQERIVVRREELLKRARGIRLRLLDEGARVDEVLSGLDAEILQDADLLEAVLWQTMVEMLPETGEELLRSLTVMEKLPQGQTKGDLLHQVRACFKSALKRQSVERQRVLTREKKKLAALGISGSAIMPKIPSQDGWDDEFRSEMERLKKELLATAS